MAPSLKYEFFAKERKCGWCKKKFVLRWPVERYGWQDGKRVFCCYSCFIANERVRIEKKAEKMAREDAKWAAY